MENKCIVSCNVMLMFLPLPGWILTAFHFCLVSKQLNYAAGQCSLCCPLLCEFGTTFYMPLLSIRETVLFPSSGSSLCNSPPSQILYLLLHTSRPSLPTVFLSQIHTCLCRTGDFLHRTLQFFFKFHLQCNKKGKIPIN